MEGRGRRVFIFAVTARDGVELVSGDELIDLAGMNTAENLLNERGGQIEVFDEVGC